jgi:hypothetical protein
MVFIADFLQGLRFQNTLMQGFLFDLPGTGANDVGQREEREEESYPAHL